MKKYVVQFCDSYYTEDELIACFEEGMLTYEDWGFCYEFDDFDEAKAFFNAEKALCKWDSRMERFEIINILFLMINEQGAVVQTLGMKTCWQKVANARIKLL